MPKFITKAILALAVMACSFFAMWPAANNGFVWDDVDYVTHNSSIRDLSPKGLNVIFTKPDFGLYKPVTMFSLALNYKFSGENPRPYHITNIALHAVNATLVFALIVLLTGNYLVAFLCAALFGVHPMHVESVAWISERKDMLYALFFLAASLAYVRFAKTASKAALTVSVLCFLLSLGAKPMGITLPAVVFVYDYLLGRQFNLRLLYEKIPYIIAAALFGVFSVFLLHSANQVHLCYTFTDKVLFAFYGVAFYIGKLLWPANLSAFYPLPFKNGVFLPWQYMAAPVLVTVAAVMLIKYFRRDRAVMAGLAFYALTVLPALQVVTVGGVITADRYSYIPSLGLFLPLVFHAVRAIAKLRNGNKWFFRTAVIGAGVLLAVLAGMARARCAVFRDNYTLFADTVAKQPVPSVYVQHALMLMEFRRPAEAVDTLMTMFARTPPLPSTAVNVELVLAPCMSVASTFMARGQYDAAKLILKELAVLSPGFPPVLMDRADRLNAAGDFKGAIALLAPITEADAYWGIVQYRMGWLYLLNGDAGRARECFDKARARDSALPAADSVFAEFHGQKK